jgi:hypothetical protein
MRISDLVREHGIASFTAEDFDFVGSKVSLDPARLILVGGQAIAVWGHLFNIPEPTGDGRPLTDDADWLGSRDDARWLCSLLGDDVELQLAGADEAGPSTAMAYIKRPDGRLLMMDFLRMIVGPENSEIHRLAVPIEVRGAKLHVLHPLLCVDSRLWNLHSIPSKRRGNGPTQAEWSLDIASAYLLHVAKTEGAREATRGVHHLKHVALSKAGRFCYLEYKINPLRSVTQEVQDAIGGRFCSDDWPVILKQVEKRRAKWVGFRRRTIKSG